MNIIKSIEKKRVLRTLNIGDKVIITNLKRKQPHHKVGDLCEIVEINRKSKEELALCVREYCDKSSKDYCMHIKNLRTNGEIWTCRCIVEKVLAEE